MMRWFKMWNTFSVRWASSCCWLREEVLFTEQHFVVSHQLTPSLKLLFTVSTERRWKWTWLKLWTRSWSLGSVWSSGDRTSHQSCVQRHSQDLRFNLHFQHLFIRRADFRDSPEHIVQQRQNMCLIWCWMWWSEDSGTELSSMFCFVSSFISWAFSTACGLRVFVDFSFSGCFSWCILSSCQAVKGF